MKKLNLGSGEFKKEGYINVDFICSSIPDVVHDLNIYPYPFDENEFDFIESNHCIEHLDNAFKTMQEIHRIGKPKAEIVIRVPHFSRGFTHPEHQSGFDVTFPFYFNKNFKGGYQGVEFEVKKVQLNWFAQKYLKKQVLTPTFYLMASILGFIFNFFANLSPFLCSKLWCYWVGGFEEIEFTLIIKK